MWFYFLWLLSNISIFIILFWTPFSDGDYVADNTAFTIFMDKSNLGNLVTCTGKTEKNTEQLLCADKDKVEPQKETFKT